VVNVGLFITPSNPFYKKQITDLPRPTTRTTKPFPTKWGRLHGSNYTIMFYHHQDKWKTFKSYVINLSFTSIVWGVTLAQLVKLLSCDRKVTGSSPGNSLLCKSRVRLRTIHKMVGPLPGPYICGSFSAPGCPFSIENICNAQKENHWKNISYDLHFSCVQLLSNNGILIIYYNINSFTAFGLSILQY